MRRGFKSEATELACEVRQELSLAVLDPLDPRRLAAHLEIPVLPLSDLSTDCPDAVRYFTGANSGEFSAGTIFRGTARLIVYNDAHAITRQASDLAHELGHALLGHAPGPALTPDGCRIWDQDCEEEAQYLAGALLVTEGVALSVVRNSTPIEAAAAVYGISVQFMQWRINVTGARKRVDRERRSGRKQRELR